MGERLYRWLVKRGVIVSPSLAFIHWVEGTASKRELEVVEQSAREVARLAESADTRTRKLLDMQPTTTTLVGETNPPHGVQWRHCTPILTNFREF